MELVKLKRPVKKVKRRFSIEGLKRRRAASRTQMILNNPMKDQATKLKVSMQKKGTITSPGTLFKKGNKLKRFKGKKHTTLSKMKQSIKMMGKPCSEKAKKINRERWLKNNPMKDPKIVKKQSERMSKTRKRLAKEGRLPNLFEKGNQIRNTGRTRFKKGYTPWNKGLTKINKMEVKNE